MVRFKKRKQRERERNKDSEECGANAPSAKSFQETLSNKKKSLVPTDEREREREREESPKAHRGF